MIQVDLSAMTSVFMRHRGEEEAECGAMWPQATDHLQRPEAGGSKNRLFPRPFGESVSPLSP